MGDKEEKKQQEKIYGRLVKVERAISEGQSSGHKEEICPFLLPGEERESESATNLCIALSSMRTRDPLEVEPFSLSFWWCMELFERLFSKGRDHFLPLPFSL